MMNLAIFASGRGSNFKAIYSQIISGKINANISCLITNNKTAAILKFAQANDINIYVQDFDKDITIEDKILKILKYHQIDLIVLAGFMKLVPRKIVEFFDRKIINIHPSLLPLFGGKGYHGINVHKKVIESGVKFTGATVHFVDENYDQGQIIAQDIISISQKDTIETIAKKVLKIEHELLPKVLKEICNDKLVWADQKPWLSQ